jgi:adenosylcobinamide kinase/adenosylcobinamide-phosphate guanylyltransferase
LRLQHHQKSFWILDGWHAHRHGHQVTLLLQFASKNQNNKTTMPATVYLITGGCRSGKSSYAQTLCEKLSPTPIYLATSSSQGEYVDADMVDRIHRHQKDRETRLAGWKTIEAPLHPSEHLEEMVERVVLVDCLTLWLTNYMLEYKVFSLTGEDITAQERRTAAEKASDAIKQEIETMIAQWNTTFVFVTNEIGSGSHASDAVSRTFVDHQGWLNQFVASKAKQVVHMVSGCPNVVKRVDDSARGAKGSWMTQDDKDDAKLLDTFLSSRSMTMDPKGYFMVKLDENRIVASFYSCIVNDKGEVCDLQGNKIKCCNGGSKREPMKVWKGRTAKELTTAIFEVWEDATELDLTIGHAAYIGRELQRAEHCLCSNIPYQQD